MSRTYSFKVESDDETLNFTSDVDGFNALEVIALLSIRICEIQLEITGTKEVKGYESGEIK